jgi:hypothetical protein
MSTGAIAHPFALLGYSKFVPSDSAVFQVFVPLFQKQKSVLPTVSPCKEYVKQMHGEGKLPGARLYTVEPSIACNDFKMPILSHGAVVYGLTTCPRILLPNDYVVVLLSVPAVASQLLSYAVVFRVTEIQLSASHNRGPK